MCQLLTIWNLGNISLLWPLTYKVEVFDSNTNSHLQKDLSKRLDSSLQKVNLIGWRVHNWNI